eukprot:5692800-Lingulodinium_polyedra.AAC.1
MATDDDGDDDVARHMLNVSIECEGCAAWVETVQNKSTQRSTTPLSNSYALNPNSIACLQACASQCKALKASGSQCKPVQGSVSQ